MHNNCPFFSSVVCLIFSELYLNLGNVWRSENKSGLQFLDSMVMYVCTTLVWYRKTSNLLICDIPGCFVEPVSELSCLMVCPESPVMAVPAAGNLTPMTAVTSVGRRVIMPMTAIVSARGEADAAGMWNQDFDLPADLLCIATNNIFFRSGSRSRSRSRGRRYRSRSRSNERQVLLLLCCLCFTVKTMNLM